MIPPGLVLSGESTQPSPYERLSPRRTLTLSGAVLVGGMALYLAGIALVWIWFAMLVVPLIGLVVLAYWATRSER